ncbi:hypothetical protein [Sphingomonas sp. UYP23]
MLITPFLLMAALQAPALLPSDHILQIAKTSQALSKQDVLGYPSLWQPSAAEAARAKVALYRFLDADRRPLLKWDRSPQIERVSPIDYEIQYLGTHINTETARFTLKGTKIILIHAAAKMNILRLGDDLDHAELLVADGGKGYFDAYYDLKNDNLIMFSFHGVA